MSDNKVAKELLEKELKYFNDHQGESLEDACIVRGTYVDVLVAKLNERIKSKEK